jgi:Ca2+:H+ antiporter
MSERLKPSLSWLLPLTPLVIALRFLTPESHVLLFILAGVAIIPLAGWMGKATEHLADRTGEALGGLLNATFGNMAELIIGIMALREGLTEVVKASLTGSILGNALLVLGAAMLSGGLKYKTQTFNAAGARSMATALTLAAIALVAPAIYHQLGSGSGVTREGALSLEISIVLLVTYALSLVFTLHTHQPLFTREAAGVGHPEPAHDVWSVRKALGLLVGATALISWLAEILVRSVEPAAAELGMTEVFIGVVVVAIVGNAAEHSTAILMALEDRMDLSMGIAIGSSVQIALFAAPVLVLLSYVVGPAPMDLVFTLAEVAAVVVAVVIVGQVAEDGQSHWLEGVQLIAVYAILALMFFFLPETSIGTE